MQNKYSYIGGNDLNGRMFVYDDEMKKFDLNATAIRTFAFAIRKGNLPALQQLFSDLTSQQKEGLLLGILIDYNDLSGDFMNLWAPYGYAINLAKKFDHPHVVSFITEETAKIESAKKNLPEPERASSPRPM